MVHRAADRMQDVPLAVRVQRTGTSRIEQRAVTRVREEVARMPASLVVQLALWPDELARWARAERIAESVVYNLLAARKPYLRMRERLAAHLGVQTGYLAALVDGAVSATSEDAASTTGESAPGELPGQGWRRRSGTNPVERRAVEVVAREIAAMPAATVVGLAIWPETLTEWARTHGFKPSAVWATLAGTPSELVATALARRLDVSVREVVSLIEAERPPAHVGIAASPSASAAPAELPVAPAEPTREPLPAAVARPAAGPSRPRAAPPRDQLSLGL